MVKMDPLEQQLWVVFWWPDECKYISHMSFSAVLVSINNIINSVPEIHFLLIYHFKGLYSQKIYKTEVSYFNV